MKQSKIVHAVQGTLRRVAPGATAILYGSEARPSSDIDVLVLLDKEKISLTDRQQISYPLYDIGLETNTIICNEGGNIIIMNKEERDAIVAYRKEKVDRVN